MPDIQDRFMEKAREVVFDGTDGECLAGGYGNLYVAVALALQEQYEAGRREAEAETVLSPEGRREAEIALGRSAQSAIEEGNAILTAIRSRP